MNGEALFIETQFAAMVIHAEITSPQIPPSVPYDVLSYRDSMTEQHYAKTDITKHLARAEKKKRQLYLKQIKGFILQPHEHIWEPRCLLVFVEGKSRVIMCIFRVHKQKTSVHFPTG